MRIFIDAGHNASGADTGAKGCGLKEQDITFKIADALCSFLKKDGHTVEMSRKTLSSNVGKTLAESINLRSKMSNNFSADLFVSIHANAGGGCGAETLIYSKNSKAYSIAKAVQSALTRDLSLFDRGVKERKDLGVLKNTFAPAILVETAFIDNADDAKKLKNNAEGFAKAIYEGITGKKVKKTIESVNDIVWELSKRGIISDKNLWMDKLSTDKNAYFLAKKTIEYMTGVNV